MNSQGKWQKLSSVMTCCCLVAKLCLTLCDPMDCSKPGFPVLHCLPEFAQTPIHGQWCHPTISSFVNSSSSYPQFNPASESVRPTNHFILLPFPPLTLNLSQHQGLFQWVGSSHQVAKVLGLQFSNHQVGGCWGKSLSLWDCPQMSL